MRKLAPGFLIPVALLLIFAACKKTDPLTEPATLLSGTGEKVGCGADAELMNLWEASQGVEWEVHSATVLPEEGGILVFTAETWTDGVYHFSIHIPPHAIPAVNGPTEITLKFPRHQRNVPASEQYDMFVILEPEGLQFHEMVRVNVCYAPWLPTDHDSFTVGWLRPYTLPSADYCVEYLDKQQGLRPVDPEDRHRGIIFKTDHFSVWDVENGKRRW